jgi:hypothetical protein
MSGRSRARPRAPDRRRLRAPRGMRTAIIAAAIVMASALARGAEPRPLDNGKAYVTQCSKAVSPNELVTVAAPILMQCIAYARGAADTFEMAQRFHPGTFNICVPASVQGVQLVEAGLRFMVQHPEFGDDSPVFSLGIAYSQNWPCK